MATKPTSTKPDTDTRQLARKMLGRGLATPSEMATLLDVSRQLMHYWARDVNWRKARFEYLLEQMVRFSQRRRRS